MKSEFLGTCINCFDEDGECLVGPFADVTEFAQAEERAEHLAPDVFYRLTGLSVDQVEALIGVPASGSWVFLWSSPHRLAMVYEPDQDVHYLFSCN